MTKRAPKKKTAGDAVSRADSYQEVFLNIGTAGDPFNYGGVGMPKLLSRVDLERIFVSDGVGRRIVEIVPEEMFRCGFTIDGMDDMSEFQSTWDELDANNKLIDAFVWSRLYGGALIVKGIDDGGELDEPAGRGALDFIRVYDRHQVRAVEHQENPELADYGEVLIWEVNPIGGNPYRVHASRCYMIDGDRLPARLRQRNQGWGASCLQGVSGALRDFGISHQMATSLLARKQQGVWKIKELAELCRSVEGKGILKERLNQVDMTRGNNNSIALDADSEDYILLNGALDGVTDVIGEKKGVIMMTTGIHESILTGENVSGINANENTALASFHKLIQRKQIDEARPAIESLLNHMISDLETWKIKFNPLGEESEAQKADRMQKQSDADTKYIDAQVLDDDEIRDTLRKRGDYVMKAGSAQPREPQDNGQTTTTPEDDEKVINGEV